MKALFQQTELSSPQDILKSYLYTMRTITFALMSGRRYFRQTTKPTPKLQASMTNEV